MGYFGVGVSVIIRINNGDFHNGTGKHYIGRWRWT